VNTYDTITIEDLAVKNLVKNHNLAKAISDMGWRQLRTMLEHKTGYQGKNLVVIGRFQPSSKLCSNCGNHKKDLKLSDRACQCDRCGNLIDSDVNAAYNIKKFGVRDNSLYADVSH